MSIRRAAFIAALLTVIAVVIVVNTRTRDPHPHIDNPSTRVTTTSVAAPTEEVSVTQPVPSGFSHDSDGAADAAVAYAQYAAVIVGMPIDKAMQVQSAVATDRVRASTVARIQQQLLALYAAASPETLSYRVGVLAVHVVMTSRDEAHAEVWQVGTLFAPNLPAYARWSTLTEDLVWERGDWRVNGEHTEPGPTPTPDTRSAPTAPADLAAQLTAFGPPGERP